MSKYNVKRPNEFEKEFLKLDKENALELIASYFLGIVIDLFKDNHDLKSNIIVVEAYNLIEKTQDLILLIKKSEEEFEKNKSKNEKNEIEKEAFKCCVKLASQLDSDFIEKNKINIVRKFKEY